MISSNNSETVANSSFSILKNADPHLRKSHLVIYPEIAFLFSAVSFHQIRLFIVSLPSDNRPYPNRREE
jgi:hypothetical protein